MVLLWDVNTLEHIATQHVDWKTSVSKLVQESLLVHYARNDCIVVFFIYVDDYSSANLVFVRNFGFHIIYGRLVGNRIYNSLSVLEDFIYGLAVDHNFAYEILEPLSFGACHLTVVNRTTSIFWNAIRNDLVRKHTRGNHGIYHKTTIKFKRIYLTDIYTALLGNQVHPVVNHYRYSIVTVKRYRLNQVLIALCTRRVGRSNVHDVLVCIQVERGLDSISREFRPVHYAYLVELITDLQHITFFRRNHRIGIFQHIVGIRCSRLVMEPLAAFHRNMNSIQLNSIHVVVYDNIHLVLGS